MNESTPHLKQRLRRELKVALGALSPEAMARDSLAIQNQIRAQPLWRQAQAVLLYRARADEPDLAPLLADLVQEGRVACLPRYDEQTGHYHAARVHSPETELRPGRFALLEPVGSCPEVALNRLDLTLVPGLGFAPTGWRLGRGGGFYDRLLSQTGACKCGVAFDCQLNVSIPAESHDVPMSYLVTPTQWLRCSEKPCVA